MSVSYMIDMEQLAVLARYMSADGFPGLPNLPETDQGKNDEVLKKLSELGMVHLQGAEASLDLGLAFILTAMAKPELMIRAIGNILCCCTKDLGVVISSDTHAKNKYRITPLPSAAEVTERMWEAVGENSSPQEFSLWSVSGGWQQSSMSKSELGKLIRRIYKEAEVQ